MFQGHGVLLNGRRYSIESDINGSLERQAEWQWCDEDDMAAPVRIHRQLNQESIRSWTEDQVRKLSRSEQRALKALLVEMEIDCDRLKRLGLERRSREDSARFAAEQRFATLPANGHSPVTNFALLQWYAPEGIQLPEIPEFNGEGPFAANDLQSLVTREPVISQRAELNSLSDLQALVTQSQNDRDVSRCVVGRSGWDKRTIDDLIEIHEGTHLRIYSQEMFAAWILTGRDPFDAGVELLTAFRIGHPTLEYVSQGWQGCVTSIVPEQRAGDSTGLSLEITRERGLLSYLGYCIGKSGKPDHERREILEQAFSRDLKFLCSIGDPDYLMEWGDPESAQRLRKMAESIAAFCRNARLRLGNDAEAVLDWQADLDWLRGEF